jgi:uncharacterized protein (DUF305 family)
MGHMMDGMLSDGQIQELRDSEGATFDRLFLEGMIAHHGGALAMAHDALQKSTNPTIWRLAREIIVAQRGEIIALRRMLAHDGLHKPEYNRFDTLFSF